MNALDAQLDAIAGAARPAPMLSFNQPPGGDPRESFAAALRHTTGPNDNAETTIERQARDTATQFVATAFIMPVLEMMQDSPFAAEPFAPNSAQKRFMPMLNWQIADRVTSAANFPLVDAIVEQIMQNANVQQDAATLPKGGIDVHG